MSRKSEALKEILKKFGGRCDHNSIDEILEAMSECEFSGGTGGGVDMSEYFETVGGDTLYWDGNTEGRTIIDLGDGAFLVHVSDVIPSIDFIHSNGGEYWSKDDGKIPLNVETAIDAGDFAMLGNAFLVKRANLEVEGMVFPKAGIYFNNMGISLKINNYTGFTTIKVNDSYLPDSAKCLHVYIDDTGNSIDKNFHEILNAIYRGQKVEFEIRYYSAYYTSTNYFMNGSKTFKGATAIGVYFIDPNTGDDDGPQLIEVYIKDDNSIKFNIYQI